MGSCYAKSFVSLGQGTEYLGPLLNLKAVLTEIY